MQSPPPPEKKGNEEQENGAEDQEEDQEEEEEIKGIKEEDITFVRVLQKWGKCLLSPSQTEIMKKNKKAALKDMIAQLAARGYGEYNEAKIKKKVENMKSRLKIKIDKKKTGNLRIVLKPAEKLLMEILDATENPSISRLKCKFYLSFCI